MVGFGPGFGPSRASPIERTLKKHAKCSAPSTSSIDRTSSAAATRPTSNPPSTPPSVAAAATRAIVCFAVCGSKRSLTTDQNPLINTAPKMAICRYSNTATFDGLSAYSHQLPKNRNVLNANARGITRNGPNMTSRRDMPMTAIIESIAAVMTIFGKSVISKCDRNTASRVALPAT
jgi:hypothetical protein